MAAYLLTLKLKVRGDGKDADIIAGALAAIQTDKIPGFISLGLESAEPVWDETGYGISKDSKES